MLEKHPIGKVVISDCVGLKDIIIMVKLLNGHILDKISSVHLSTREYIIWSNYFDLISEGEEIPTYSIELKTIENRKILLSDIKKI